MVASVQQRIMERPLGESRFSGKSQDYENAVDIYSRELGRRYRAWAESENVSASSNPISPKSLDATPSKGSKGDDLNEALKEVRDWLEKSSEPRAEPRVTFTPMQEWEGFVTYCDEHFFTVKVSDVKDPHGVPTEEAEFEMRELAPEDRKEVKPGSIVRWAIGLERHSNDRRQRVSKVHLRRLPVFTRSDIEKAREGAEALLQVLAD